MESSERTRSVWATSDGAGAYPKLDGRTDTDVCVVGAGLAGLTTAYLLSKSGRRVVVLDDNDAGGGETGQTTAHLASANDVPAGIVKSNPSSTACPTADSPGTGYANRTSRNRISRAG